MTTEGLDGLTGTITIDGSSTVFPVTEAVAEEFQNATKQNVKVTVGISGTGGGFKKFTRGETDISGASRPILKAEMEAAKEKPIEYVELPVCFDALTIAVHPSCDWIENDTITVAELKKIWEPDAEGKITHWNQINEKWPNEKIELFGAGTDSGTFDYFTEAINGKAKASRGDYAQSEDDNTLVQGIEGNKYALGYVPFAYYEPNKSRLKALKVDSGNGGVAPSEENVISGAYQPLSRPLFIYVSKAAAARPEVKKFVEFYIDNVPTLAKEVKYVPLPPDAYPLVKARFDKLEAGTAFGGVPEVGVSVKSILERQPTQ
ncbi:MAG: PstS family phosphate ABC transporter substrate-binding protein [Pirellulaceae bacterium]|nr:PstS family phosphate ABC transporter substrate-binding protein [Pirellulaceae bacterium]